MFSYFTDHEYMPCEKCGMSLTRVDRRSHVCDADRRARFEAFQARHAVAEFERELGTFLDSPVGRFAVYYAERDRRRREL